MYNKIDDVESDRIKLMKYTFKYCQNCKNIDFYQIMIPFLFIIFWLIVMVFTVYLEVYSFNNFVAFGCRIFYILFTLCLTTIEKIKYVTLKPVNIENGKLLYELTDDNYVSVYEFFIKFINRDWFVDFKKIENHKYMLYTNRYPINIYNCRIYKIDDVMYILYLKYKLKLEYNIFP